MTRRNDHAGGRVRRALRNGRRALVTGCTAFIGSHLTEPLLGDHHAVLGVDCFNENYARAQKLHNLERARSWDALEFVPIDLSRGDLEDLVDEADASYHLAAEPGVRAADITAARAGLGYEPHTALAEGLREDFEWTLAENHRTAE
jgi:nucleoside-diphosphate-sugar epimerase